jgi:DNA primase
MQDTTVEEIKSKLDIVDVIGHYITLRKAGANFKGNCPFHNEKTPSFMVNRERQFYKCFGCGESGDMFAFIMKQENLDFPNAMRLLAGQAGVIVPERVADESRHAKQGFGRQDLYTVNNTAAKFFHQVLTSHPAGKEALAYLHKRGVTDASIKHFMIGFAPLNTDPVQQLLQKQGIKQNVLRAAGSPERFRNRIMFPFRDVIGNVVGFSGRAMGDVQPKYLNTADTEIFHKTRYLYGLYEGKKNIADAKKIMLVEGQLDLVLAHQSGSNYAVATSGTALTDDHMRILRRYGDTLLIAFDGDTAGYKATDRAIQYGLTHSFEMAIVAVPAGTDPGELIVEKPEEWKALLDGPQSVIDWLLLYYFPNGETKKSTSEREKIFEALFPYIAHQPDVISQSHLLQRLGLLLGITQEKVMNEAFEKWQKKAEGKSNKEKVTPESQKPTESTPTPPAPADDDTKTREKSVIALLLIQPSLLEYNDYLLEEKDFTHPTYNSLYKLIQNWYTENTNKSSPTQLLESVLATLPKAAHPGLQKLLFDTQSRVADLSAEQILQEYMQLIHMVRQQQREFRIQSFASQIAQAEAAGDRAKVMALIQQMQGQG